MLDKLIQTTSVNTITLDFQRVLYFFKPAIALNENQLEPIYPVPGSKYSVPLSRINPGLWKDPYHPRITSQFQRLYLFSNRRLT